MWIRTSHSSKRQSDPGGKGIGLTVWWSPCCLSAWDLHQVSLNIFNCEMQIIMLHSGKELLMLKWMHEWKMISSAVSIISEHIVDTQRFNALFYTQICSVYHFDPPSAKNSYSEPIAHVNQFCQRSRWWATGWRNASSCIIPKLQCLTVGMGRTEPSWEGEVALCCHLLWDHRDGLTDKNISWGSYWAQSTWLGSVRDDNRRRKWASCLAALSAKGLEAWEKQGSQG